MHASLLFPVCSCESTLPGSVDARLPVSPVGQRTSQFGFLTHMVLAASLLVHPGCPEDAGCSEEEKSRKRTRAATRFTKVVHSSDTSVLACRWRCWRRCACVLGETCSRHCVRQPIVRFCQCFNLSPNLASGSFVFSESGSIRSPVPANTAVVTTSQARLGNGVIASRAPSADSLAVPIV